MQESRLASVSEQIQRIVRDLLRGAATMRLIEAIGLTVLDAAGGAWVADQLNEEWERRPPRCFQCGELHLSNPKP